VKPVRLLIVVATVLLVLITYFTGSIASTDHHTAYCSQINNAAMLYLGNPNLSQAEFTAARKRLVNVLNEGDSFPMVPGVGTLLAYQYAINGRTTNNDYALEDYANFSRQVTASFLVADNC
jgi:hypothetical protein